jgi:hypothetical protein
MRVLFGGMILGLGLLTYACAGGDSTSSPSGGGGHGAVGGTTSGGGNGGTTSGGGTGGLVTGGNGGTTTGGSGGAAGSGGSAGSSGGAAGAGNTGGTAGAAGSGATWPTCDSQPNGVPQKTILDIWNDNPSTETEVWVPGVYITAISGNGCVAGQTCQIFLQQEESYVTFAAGAKHAIHMRISANVALHFVGLAVGDRVDAMGWAWRYNLNGENDMAIQVNAQLPGCAKKVGTGNPQPISVQYSDLTVNAYEQTTGPLLVQLSTVTGKPALATEIFGLWETGVGIGDAGPTGLVNASPYFLDNHAFVGLPTDGQTPVNFQTVTGVFGVYVPIVDSGTPPKYVVVYPRANSELVQI